MSWADDIRCLYCDGRLPLYRKITNGQFCSSAHRKAYWQEQERLAVERLHQTHDSLRAHPLRVPVESILGKTDPDLAAFEFDSGQERPEWMVQANTGQVPLAGFLRDRGVIHPRWMPDRILVADPGPLAVNLPWRFLCVGIDPATSFAFAAAIPISRFAAHAIPAAILAPAVNCTAFNILPIREFALLAAPITPEPEDAQPPAPLADALYPLSRFVAIALPAASTSNNPEPLVTLLRVELPLFAQMLAELPAAAPVEAGLRPMPANRIVPQSALDGLRALDLRSVIEIPQITLQTPPVRPRLRLAAGRRYAVESSNPARIVEIAADAIESSAPAVSLPVRSPKILRAAAASVKSAPASKPAFEPAAAGLLPLDYAAQAAESRDVRTPLTLPQPPRTEPMRPGSRLEPVRDFMASPPLPAVDPKRANVWAVTVDFWNRAPRDLKMLAFAIPVLLALALHPALPKVRVSASSSAIGHNVQTAVNTQWANFKQTVFDRAAIALDEDFRSGLDDWASRGDATTDWSFDETGFVRPGPLALYRPSLGLTDYQLQFLGMIDRNALSWVVRASDFDNYYVIKMVVLKPGPIPTLGITRYAVVNGKADSRADVVVPVDARNDTLYRVRMDVNGDDFALSVQGQMVDAWSEPRLAHGGVGFFTARGEESRLRWVQVTHQYDMLGRLCAYLAPPNIPPETARLEQ